MNTTTISRSTIEAAMARVALQFGCSYEGRYEDSFTWLTLTGNITPDQYKDLSQAVANETNVNFYFNKITVGEMEGVVDWDMDGNFKYSSVPDYEVEDYGTKFEPEVPKVDDNATKGFTTIFAGTKMK